MTPLLSLKILTHILGPSLIHHTKFGSRRDRSEAVIFLNLLWNILWEFLHFGCFKINDLINFVQNLQDCLSKSPKLNNLQKLGVRQP